MRNSSQVSHFTLGAYFDTGPLRWLYFLILMSVYALIVLSNLLLIVVICLNRTLHEPMYIFLCSLLINEIYGSTVFLLFLSYQILQDIHTVSYDMCLLQFFGLYTYESFNLTNLTVMSYDRYMAICFPLQYNTRMNFNKVLFLIVLVYLPPFVAVLITTILTASLTLCGNFINAVYCDNYEIIKLSCFDTTINNWYEVVAATVTVVLPLVLIFNTYIWILKVCFNGSNQTRQKALSTCTPHLFSVVNFAFGFAFQIFQTRFDMSHLPPMLRIFLSTYHLTCQPLLSTPMYGLNLSKIRIACKKILFKSKNKITILEMK